MTPAILVLDLGLAALGFCALCLGMARHHGAVLAAPLPPRRRLALRVVGWGLLLLPLAVTVPRAGWGVGTVQWVGSLTGAALVPVLALSYRPRAIPWIAALCAALSLGAALLLPPIGS